MNDYNAHLKQIELSKLPTITRINGNGQPYVRPLPEIEIGTINEVALKHVEENTGMKFTPAAWGGFKAQPQTHEQLATFMLSYNWEYKYYDNATFHNVIRCK